MQVEDDVIGTKLNKAALDVDASEFALPAENKTEDLAPPMNRFEAEEPV